MKTYIFKKGIFFLLGSLCLLACGPVVPICGNGVIEEGESCDDNNAIDGDGCRANCSIEICGDGKLDAIESCDDNNTIDGDGCNKVCVVEFCGDGSINNSIESCDDNNNEDGDGCNAGCELEFCGDGLVNNSSTEACDDGNNEDGDGCNAGCQAELFCGDDISTPGELCLLSPSQFSIGDAPRSVAIGDLNGDSFPDIVTANLDSDNVSVLLGMRDGTFFPQQSFSGGRISFLGSDRRPKRGFFSRPCHCQFCFE